ncbi:hypothetical protein ACFQ1S_31720 [Kibdelosporangium lantanae]|uniref:Uncharacterized protein n=1 Tax=Kibdelosporangium lantanae TaxID=1497396 RepID=A0ABW3MI69_9PSEU
MYGPRTFAARQLLTTAPFTTRIGIDDQRWKVACRKAVAGLRGHLYAAQLLFWDAVTLRPVERE